MRYGNIGRGDVKRDAQLNSNFIHAPALHPMIGWRRGQRHRKGNAMSGAMYDNVQHMTVVQ